MFFFQTQLVDEEPIFLAQSAISINSTFSIILMFSSFCGLAFQLRTV